MRVVFGKILPFSWEARKRILRGQDIMLQSNRLSKPNETTVERDQTRRAVVRDGRSPPRFRRPYSARGDFGKISAFQGIGASLDSAGRRSLTAAQAATGFTRSCVLGFRRKLVTFGRSVMRGCAKCFQWHFAYLFPYFFQGIPVPLLRYGERYALFVLLTQRRTRRYCVEDERGFLMLRRRVGS